MTVDRTAMQRMSRVPQAANTIDMCMSWLVWGDPIEQIDNLAKSCCVKLVGSLGTAVQFYSTSVRSAVRRRLDRALGRGCRKWPAKLLIAHCESTCGAMGFLEIGRLLC